MSHSKSGPFSTGVAPALSAGVMNNLDHQYDDAMADAAAAYVPRSSAVLNVKSYGAAGDGTTNDQAAIITAIQALPASGGTVYFPRGTYMFHDITLTQDNVTLKGDGKGSVLQSTRLVTDNVIALWLIGSNLDVSDLSFLDTNQITSNLKPGGISNGDMIRLGGNTGQYTDNTVERVWVNGGYTSGIQVNHTTNATIRNCTVRNTNGNGIGFGECAGYVRAESNTILNTGDDAIAVVTATGVIPSDTAFRVHIINNTMQDIDGKGIGTSGVDYAIIRGNHIKNTWSFGISCFQDGTFGLGPSSRCLVEGNTLEMIGYEYGPTRRNPAAASNVHAINIGAVPQAKVRGNLLVNGTARGINATGTLTDIEVSGNTVIQMLGPGIEIGNPDATDFTGVKNCVISGNIIRQVQGGIVAGGGESFAITGNVISTYLFGGSGSRRGITLGRAQYGVIGGGNMIVNDDGGSATTFTYNSCQDVSIFGNVEVSNPADTDHGSAFMMNGGNRIAYGAGTPATGTWLRGDIVLNTAPADGVTAGWYCRTGGTPGTWQPWGVAGQSVLSVGPAWTPPSVASGAFVSQTFTITGAVVGDPVSVGFTPAVPAGVILSASITTNNTATVTLLNMSGSTVALAAGTLRIIATHSF